MKLIYDILTKKWTELETEHPTEEEIQEYEKNKNFITKPTVEELIIELQRTLINQIVKK